MKKIANFLLLLSVFVSTFFLSSCSTDTTTIERFINEGEEYSVAVCAAKNDYKAITTIISDDGYYDSGVILNELATLLDLRVTVAGCVNFIEGYRKKWQQIESENHVEIISHSYTHTRYSDQMARHEVVHEYLHAKEYYEQYFKTPSFTMVVPENYATEKAFDVMKESGILAARLGSRGENPLSGIEYGSKPGQWLNLYMRGLYDSTDNNVRNSWIDSAIENGTWLIEMWHDISPNGDVHFQPISTTDAYMLLSYMAEKQNNGDLWVASFTDAVSYIYQKDNTAIAAYILNDSIAVNLKKQRDDLPWEEFKIPLSVKLSLPQGWKNVSIRQGENVVEHICTEENNIIFDMSVNDGPLYISKIS